MEPGQQTADLQAQGQLPEAACENALAMLNAQAGADPLPLAQGLAELAGLQEDRGAYEAAAQAAQRALSL